jgi:hypothetical protein
VRQAFGLILLALPAALTAAMAPMNGPLALVAGNGQIGFADGPFLEAKFDRPMGLVLDPGGKILYVADSGNHRIRTIDISHRVAVVGTLAGGKAGTQDGPLDQARFAQPEGLFAAAKGLAVIDQQKTLRLIDLSAKTVSTPLRSQTELLAYAETGGPEALILSKTRDLFALGGVSATALRRLPYPAMPYLADSLITVRQDAFIYAQDGGLFKADLTQLLAPSATAGVWISVTSTGVHQGELIPYRDPFDGAFALLLDHGHNDFQKFLPSFGLTPLGSYGVSTLITPLTKDERRIAGQIGGAAQDPEARCLYYSDPPSNRILRLKDYRYATLANIEALNSVGLREFDYPRTVPPDTTRIAFVGSSMIFKSPRIGDEERVRSMPKRLETWLNLLSSLQGCPRSYEVLGYVEPASNNTTIPIRVTEYAPHIKNYNASEIWLAIDYHNLCDEMVGWLVKGRWAGQVEPTYPASSSAEKAKALPPDVAQIRAELMAAEKKYIALNIFSFDARGGLLLGYYDRFGSWYQLLDDPKLRKEMLALYRQSLERMKAKLPETWPGGTVPPITIIHIPVRNILNMSENDGGGRDPGDHVIDDFFDRELASMAKDLGFAFVSNLDVARVLSSSYNPVFVPGDNHMTRSGQDMHALAAAIRLLKRDGCPAP